MRIQSQNVFHQNFQCDATIAVSMDTLMTPANGSSSVQTVRAILTDIKLALAALVLKTKIETIAMLQLMIK